MFHVEHAYLWSDFIISEAKKLSIPINPFILSQLVNYSAELRNWNKRINLTAITDEKDIIVKHFLDSLVATAVLTGSSAAASLLDIGTGAGFPGIPLKLCFPEMKLTLLEPSQKKTAFLLHIIGRLQLEGVKVISKRVGQLPSDPLHRDAYTYITSRAVDAMEIVPHAPSLLAPGGQLVMWRSKGLERKEEYQNVTVVKELEYELPGVDVKRCLVICVRPQPRNVPRGT
jgi:16S rRNA (guanine527-N7)-methyltransferase